MSITKAPWGKMPDSTPVELYTLTNVQGAIAKVTTYGAILTELRVPDHQAKLANVVLGFNSLAPYLKGHPYFGATIGRYANRIAKGRFTLLGKTYYLPKNEKGLSTLHGGTAGFDKKLWSATISNQSLLLKLRSPDGDQGFPGNLTATVSYTLTDNNELVITFQAVTDASTHVNLCNHSYFNLSGTPPSTAPNSIMDHILQIHADSYTPVNDDLIPTGQIAPVAGTPLDFTQPTPVAARAADVPGGYDHNFVLNHKTPGDLVLAATMLDPASGRIMDVLTTQPAIQFYAGNFLDGNPSNPENPYPKHSGFCLETQHYPDSPNQPAFPTTIVEPGQTYFHRAVYRFRTL